MIPDKYRSWSKLFLITNLYSNFPIEFPYNDLIKNLSLIFLLINHHFPIFAINFPNTRKDPLEFYSYFKYKFNCDRQVYLYYQTLIPDLCSFLLLFFLQIVK